MVIGVPKESFPGERRVALVPSVLPGLQKAGFQVVIEAGAGIAAGYPDAEFIAKGAKVIASRSEVFQGADIVAQVLCYGANDKTGQDDLPLMRKGQYLVGFLRSLGSLKTVEDIAARGVTSLAMDLMPRITRAQSMDAMSSMATLSGYEAVLMAADILPRIFPMLTTAAGTVTPARVLIVGAGVAGLQAIATARRLGAVVSAYDLRPVAKEHVQSLGARFVELPIEAAEAEDKGGYAKAQDEGFYHRQQDLLARVVAQSDVVITAASVPGKKAPVLITRAMVERMMPGSVIVDLSAERGGNCEVTRLNQTVVERGVHVIGTINMASSVPYHASQLYAYNVAHFLTHLFQGGRTELDLNDEITRETLLTRNGELVNQRVRDFHSAAAPASS
jgi:proton-translocating NAD(P)+ transhydrogenase subunit alpha